MITASQPDKRTVLKELMELGKSKGQLTNKEILDAIGEMDIDPEHLEKFYDTLETNGIEIVETLDDIMLNDAELSSITSNDMGDDDLESEPIMDNVAIDDPVKIYLKEIGRVPLLTPDEEMSLAMRISTGVLNELLAEATQRVQPPTDKGRRLKIMYVTQASVKPPTFVFFVNDFTILSVILVGII